MTEEQIARELIAAAKLLASEVGDVEEEEPVGSTPVKTRTKRLAGRLPTVEDLIERYIDRNWTTAEPSWKRDALKNATAKWKGDDLVVSTWWNLDDDWADDTQEVEFIISITDD